MGKWNPFNGKKRREGNVIQLPAPKPRSIDEVTRDYNTAALELGHLTHQQEVTGNQIAGLHARMAQLGNEAKAITDAEKAKAPAEAPQV